MSAPRCDICGLTVGGPQTRRVVVRGTMYGDETVACPRCEATLRREGLLIQGDERSEWLAAEAEALASPTERHACS